MFQQEVTEVGKNDPCRICFGALTYYSQNDTEHLNEYPYLQVCSSKYGPRGFFQGRPITPPQ